MIGSFHIFTDSLKPLLMENAVIALYQTRELLLYFQLIFSINMLLVNLFDLEGHGNDSQVNKFLRSSFILKASAIYDVLNPL
jgi:hypothetical protein